MIGRIYAFLNDPLTTYIQEEPVPSTSPLKAMSICKYW